MSEPPPAGAADDRPREQPDSIQHAPSGYRPWLHAYAILLVVATFALVAVGGTVTSKGAGMAVPDWPTTFDHNMFTAPPSVWWHQTDTFWEHFHRLMGSLVGLLTIGLVVWLWTVQRDRRWLCWLSVGFLGLVIVQGLMGGFRVTEESIPLAIVHGIVGQVVLGLTVLFAAATSRVWARAIVNRGAGSRPTEAGRPHGVGRAGGGQLPRGLRYLTLVLLGVLVVQLALGAWMRHHGAGLAVPDFPTAYGQVLPPTSQGELDQAIVEWTEYRPYDNMRPFTVGQVWVHMGHRTGAGVVLAVAMAVMVWLTMVSGRGSATRWPGRWLMVLVGAQVGLGMMVVWSQKHVDVATAHQALGAGVLAVAVWLTVRVWLESAGPAEVGREPLEAGAGDGERVGSWGLRVERGA